MNIEELLISPNAYINEDWQVGNNLYHEPTENAIVLIFCKEYRGAGQANSFLDTKSIRQAFYSLGQHQNPCKVVDLGDIILGKTLADSRCALEEIIFYYLEKKAIPVVVGGSQDLNETMAWALSRLNKAIHYANFSPILALEHGLSPNTHHQNYISQMLSKPELKITQYSHLAYQEHLNSLQAFNTLNTSGCELVKLSDMMWTCEQAEPYFRHANMVGLSLDAVESNTSAISIKPQVNGLNTREICAYAKEIGLAPYLQILGLWNIQLANLSELNAQLIAQILWYFIDGVGIKLSHPSSQNTETYVLMVDNNEYIFQRDILRNRWYFGGSQQLIHCLPCSKADYLQAKNGNLSLRLEKHLKLQAL
jgi:hypothetical protein